MPSSSRARLRTRSPTPPRNRSCYCSSAGQLTTARITCWNNANLSLPARSSYAPTLCCAQHNLSMTQSKLFIQVIDCLKLEAEAVAQAAAHLQPAEIEQALTLLHDCRGKIVVVGVGKSGNVAQKIAATLTSTGTLAVYLHPSDALHGGLGVVTSEDVVVVVSNSGETDEILSMLPYLKHRRVPIIVIIGNLRSTLAQRADVRLDASVEKEACPLGLAPTTSTTVALAIGDALAIALMQCKELTPEAFALNHPAGRLGKRLSLRVSDVMHGGTQNPTINSAAPLLEVV